MPEYPLKAIPDGDLVSWVIGWRDRSNGTRGTDYVDAAHADEAKRGYEADHPSREVINLYQSVCR